MSGADGTSAVAQASLMDRAVELERAAKRIGARKAAEADKAALRDALRTFTRLGEQLAPTLDRVQALATDGDAPPLPPGAKKLAKALIELAERIDADPVAVRERQQEIDRVEQFSSSASASIEGMLKRMLADARRGAQDGIVRSLRSIGLTDAASSLMEALEVLDAFEDDLPRTTDDLRAVKDAGAKIQTTFASLEEPRYDRLVKFLQRTSAASPPTLADIDCGLLEELQASGAAHNFVIRPRER